MDERGPRGPPGPGGHPQPARVHAHHRRPGPDPAADPRRGRRDQPERADDHVGPLPRRVHAHGRLRRRRRRHPRPHGHLDAVRLPGPA
ncbi:hypothetical protein ACFFX0_26585 [Citricoccus parietis]|uniref:Uncharacterized protein n=1 Tax=Citricoccus parietis TaxID=592307 RepID=A0ABV5G6K3_9MICC